MNDETIRGQIGTAVLIALLHLRTDKGPYSGEAALEIASALLPAVCEIAATEIEWIATEHDNRVVTTRDLHEHAARLRECADDRKAEPA